MAFQSRRKYCYFKENAITEVDYKEGVAIRSACYKRHAYYIDTGSFWGCDEEIGFSNFSSGCFYNYR